MVHQDLLHPALGGNEGNDRFGYAVQAGDFNCDGHQDLAFSIPYENTYRGAVSVIFWDDSAPNPEYPFSQGIPLFRDDPGVESYPNGAVPTSSTSDRFGHSLAVGDFNDDGCDDLAIGIPYSEIAGLGWSNQGAFQVRYGDGTNPLSTGEESAIYQPLAPVASYTSAYLGYSLAAGDFNYDGADDLAIGAYNTRSATGQSGAGRVYVCYGEFDERLHGDLIQECHSFSQEPAAATVSGQFFGRSLAAGNFNGTEEDGAGDDWNYDDLAIGAPGASTVTGRVFIRVGRANGLRDDSGYYFIEAPDPSESFGAELAVGDLQHDTVDDLLVGAPVAGGGHVYVFAPEVDIYADEPEPIDFFTDYTEAFDQTGAFGTGEITPCFDCSYGSSLATADVNGDGLDDVLVGVYSPTNYTSGYFTLRYGANFGHDTPTNHLGFTAIGQDPASTNQSGDYFGFAIAPIDLWYQDTVGRGFDDLAIAAPYDDYDGFTNTGVVVLARPVETGDWGPVSGIFQGAVDHMGYHANLRVGVTHDTTTGEVRARLWVDSGVFAFSANDCTNLPWYADEYEDNNVYYYAGEDVLPADSGTMGAGPIPHFSSNFIVILDNDHGVYATVYYSAVMTDYNSETGQWDGVDINVYDIRWAWDDEGGSCTPVPSTIDFGRVNPAYY